MTRAAKARARAPAPTDNSVPFEAWLRLETGQHTAPVRQMQLTDDGKTLVTAGDCTLRVWDAQRRQALRVLRGRIGPEVDNTPGHGQVLRFAISRDSASVVALKSWRAHPARARSALTTELQIFALATGNLVAAFNLPGRWVDLDFSPDGRWLVVAGCGARSRATLHVYAWADVLGAGFAQAPAATSAAAFGSCATDDDPPVAARFVPGPLAGGSAAVVVVATNPAQRNGSVTGKLVWAALSARGQLMLQHSTLVHGPIVPSTLAVSTDWAAIAGRGATSHAPGQLLCHDHQGQLRATHATESPPSALAFSAAGGRLLVGLRATHPNAGTVQASVYDTAGGVLRVNSTYFAHDDTVAAVAFCDDGTAVSSGGDDQALHFWSPVHRVGQASSVLRGAGRTLWNACIDDRDQIGFGALPARRLPTGHAKRQQRFDLKTLTLHATDHSQADAFGKASRKWSLGPGAPGPTIALHCRANDGDRAASPDLTLFVGTDDEWVVFSRSGCYTASAEGDKYFGHHVNRGPASEALFVPSDRFKDVFDKRHLVKAVIRHGSQARAERAERLAFPEPDVTGLLPPIVELLSDPVVQGRHVTLHFKVESPSPDKNPVDRVWMLQNEYFAWEAATLSPDGQYSVTRPLRPGRNTFTLFAKGPRSVSLPVAHTEQGPAASAETASAGGLPEAGNLYLLCVGVSQFAAAGDAAEHGFEPLKYAHKDAAAIFNALGKGRFGRRVDTHAPLVNKAFKAVHARLLLNEQATKAAILQELGAMCSQIQERDETHPAERDVLFVFLSGHGVRPKGTDRLFFWNHDLDVKRLRESGLSMTELGAIAAAVPGELVLAIDACHSGLAGSDTLAGINAEELARRMQSVNERGIYIMNAARNDQAAMEHADIGNGIFTYAMLKALRDERSLLAEQPGAPRGALSMMGLIAAVQELVSFKASNQQTSVFRTYGDLLPLTIYKR